MANKITPEAKSLKEIIQAECSLRRFKEINLAVFNHGVSFDAKKVFLYFRPSKNKYIIVLQGDNGYLVNTEFEPYHGESEFQYLCLQDESQDKDDPKLLNVFTYVLYDKNMDEVIDS